MLKTSLPDMCFHLGAFSFRLILNRTRVSSDIVQVGLLDGVDLYNRSDRVEVCRFRVDGGGGKCLISTGHRR